MIPARDFFLGLVESRSWGTPVEPLWSDPLGADLANIEAAAAWAMKRQDAEAAQRLAVALDHFFLFCFPSEARRLAVLEESLALPSRVDSTSALGARAQALQRCGLRLISTNPQRSIEKLEEGAGLFEQLGDSAGLALCISSRGNARMLLGDLVGARSDCLQGVARSTAAGDRQAAAWALESAGAAALLAQNWEAAVDELSRAADDFAERSTPLGACRSLFELSIAHQMRGDWIAAVDACKRALQHERDYRLVAEWADIIDVVARLSGGCATSVRRPNSTEPRLAGVPPTRRSPTRRRCAASSSPTASDGSSGNAPGLTRTSRAVGSTWRKQPSWP